MYEVLEKVGLPVLVEREVHKGIKAMVPGGDTVYKNPGDEISAKEFEESGQGPDEIAHLIEIGAIKKGAR